MAKDKENRVHSSIQHPFLKARVSLNMKKVVLIVIQYSLQVSVLILFLLI